MSTLSRRLLIPLMAVIALLAATAPAPAARAVQTPDWYAWHLKVDFPEPLPGQQRRPHIIYTRYGATDDPVTVTSWQQIDISSYCFWRDLSYDQDGYALFNGSTSYIRCPIPPKPAGVQDCDKGAFWFAADVRLSSQPLENPIFEGVEASNREFTFSLPRSGSMARTRLRVNGQIYTSDPWSVGSSTDGNRMMLGANGPAIVAVAKHFNALGFGWLSFMDTWEGYFGTDVSGPNIKHLAQSPDAASTNTRTGRLWTHPDYVYIGYSPTAGAYFSGALLNGEIDPPGCRVG